jgi:hypothetical protein
VQNRFKLHWDADQIAAAFGVTVDDIREYLTDGRRVSFIIERRLKWDHPGWTLAPSEGAGYDLTDPNGGKWEVRSVTGGGVYFNPSNQVGSGRRFNELGFQDKLSRINGFILADIMVFPCVDIYVVPVSNVLRWHRAKLLGKNARVSRSVFLKELAPTISFAR